MDYDTIKKLKINIAGAGGPLTALLLDVRDRWRCLRANAPAVPFGTDGVGYEALIIFMERRRLLAVPGDLLEIGTGLGGGALKLSLWLERRASAKTLHVMDIFGLDWGQGDPRVMNLYLPGLKKRYAGLAQRDIYAGLIGARGNVATHVIDSLRVRAPARLCFAFVDGNHEARYVENDFALCWSALSPGGALALHDYRYNDPALTRMLDVLTERYQAEIADREVDAGKHILYLVKK